MHAPSLPCECCEGGRGASVIDSQLMHAPSCPCRAVQNDPSGPRVDRACFQRLKLKYDEPLLYFAFNFNLRPYIQVSVTAKFGSNAVGWMVDRFHHGEAMQVETCRNPC